MNNDNIRKNVIDCVSKLFKEKGFDIDGIEYMDLVEDLGMDSLTFISTTIEIENEFDIEIPSELLLLDNFKSVDEIVEIVCNVRSLNNGNGE